MKVKTLESLFKNKLECGVTTVFGTGEIKKFVKEFRNLNRNALNAYYGKYHIPQDVKIEFHKRGLL